MFNRCQKYDSIYLKHGNQGVVGIYLIKTKNELKSGDKFYAREHVGVILSKKVLHNRQSWGTFFKQTFR